jgi:hypothetical protein
VATLIAAAAAAVAKEAEKADMVARVQKDETNQLKSGNGNTSSSAAAGVRPLYVAKHVFVAAHPKQLNLVVGDAVDVVQKLPSGWWHGVRLRDSQVCDDGQMNSICELIFVGRLAGSRAVL